MAHRYTLPGKVYLTGAGPGSAKLLTLQAVELLQRADLVLHDDLISEDVLTLIPAHVAVQNVGKRRGVEKPSQESIQQRIITAARNGQTVVHLKGGDPSDFAPTQEEVAALLEAGVEFEIIGAVAADALTNDNVLSGDPGEQQPVGEFEELTQNPRQQNQLTAG
ncbi:MAG: SAM-dependent methyltransferase [Candidatus Acidiferrum sp.]